MTDKPFCLFQEHFAKLYLDSMGIDYHNTISQWSRYNTTLDAPHIDIYWRTSDNPDKIMLHQLDMREAFNLIAKYILEKD